MLDLTNERVLVTGGTGFLGRHVCARLERAGVETIGIGRQECRLSDADAVKLCGLLDRLGCSCEEAQMPAARDSTAAR